MFAVMNSRVCVTDDILLTDNLDKYIESVLHDEIPILPQRNSKDLVVNRFGKKKNLYNYVIIQDWLYITVERIKIKKASLLFAAQRVEV